MGVAQKLFDEMSDFGVHPNSLTYSVLIHGVLRMRDIQHVRELMAELWQNINLDMWVINGATEHTTSGLTTDCD